ncbi:hypothetical protein CU098_006384, partial [Rhizopus stolonifer]
NIYVYCSREGLPDSHRNPKANPQRNRPSQRCECRWRIVLYENNGIWEFRKSQNSDAFIHNHTLMKPEDIKKEWPREVCEMIFGLARQRLPTHEIRQRVRERYPTISWDDRRFYNRLSEERQKMKQRDIAARTTHLINLSAQICMLNAGSEDLSRYVEDKLTALLQDTCRFTNNTDTTNLPLPFPQLVLSSSKKSFESSLPKGYLAVTIPEYTFQIKMHHQNSTGDTRRAIHNDIEDEDSLSSPSSPSSSQQNLIFPQQDPMNHLQEPQFYHFSHPMPTHQYNNITQYQDPYLGLGLINPPPRNQPMMTDMRPLSYVFPSMPIQDDPTKIRYDPRSIDKRSFYPTRPTMAFTSSDSMVLPPQQDNLNFEPYLARRQHSFLQQQQFRRSSGPN